MIPKNKNSVTRALRCLARLISGQPASLTFAALVALFGLCGFTSAMEVRQGRGALVKGSPFRFSTGKNATFEVRIGLGVDPLVVESAQEFLSRLEQRHEIRVAMNQPGSAPFRLVIAENRRDVILDPYRSDLPERALPAQGFVLKQVQKNGQHVLLCYGADPLGARYGLIEILRRLQSDETGVHLDVTELSDAPAFPFRQVYINLSAHQMNNYNPAIITGDPEFDWSLMEWKQFIDMISFFRYNWLELWLPPHLFNLKALEGGHPYDRFVAIMNQMADYAHTRGVQVDMLAPVNCTVGTGSLFNDIPFWARHNMPAYRYLCPRIPSEHESIVKLWRHWVHVLDRVDAWSLFPGDPGGCMANGCDATTAVDLYLDISRIINESNPGGRVIAHIWHWFGWGKTFLTPDRADIERGPHQVARIDRGNEYLMTRIADFPRGTQFVLNPEDYEFRTKLAPRKAVSYIERLSKGAAVTTWSYFVTEGEGWINHAYRIPQILEARRAESTLPVSGGITYTMTPHLNWLNLYAGAEAFWNPAATEEEILEGYTEGIFGQENLHLKEIFPTYQVAPTVGYTFMGAPSWRPDFQKLGKAMRRNSKLLGSVELPRASRFPTAIPTSAYLDELRYFADLYARLSAAGQRIEQATTAMKKLPRFQETKGALNISDLKEAGSSDRQLHELYRKITDLDLPGLRERYARKHYGVFFAHPNEFTPLVPQLVDNFFVAFGYRFLQPDSAKHGEHEQP